MRATLAVLAFLAASGTAVAQIVPNAPDPSRIHVRLGPVWMNPTLSLTNAGVDTNVFNAADATHLDRDFTMTITPQTDLWLRVGRTWINGTIKEDLVWYRKYSSERSANNDYKIAWVVPLTRIAFSVGGNWVSTRDRPGFEIDARSDRTEGAYNGAVEYRALSRTYIGVRGERRSIHYDESAVFLGTNLHDALNRTMTTGAVTVREDLTTLTTLTVDVAREEARFDFDPLRNSNSTLVEAGLKFDQLAFVTGSMRLGFRDFSPLGSGVPAYQGATAIADLACVAFGFLRMRVQGMRDVQYSYDADEPYYLLTGITGAVTQQIFGPLDVEARVGAHRLAYREREGSDPALADRIDHVRTYGVGVGYHLGENVRVAFNIDHNSRTSPLESHTYHGWRYGTAATYGF